MATIINDRDNILQAAAVRIQQLNSDYISVKASDTTFKRDGSTVTPSSITLTFSLNGRLYGTPTITYSNVSSVTITYPTSSTVQVIVDATNVAAGVSFFSVTATLVLWGNTYTVTAKVSDDTAVPSNVDYTSISLVPQGTSLKLSWKAADDIDIYGYEVRDSDSNWGSAGYLYKGLTTSCTVTPGSLNVAKTFWIKAYDYSKKYSAVAVSGSYTVAKPTTPTNLDKSFSTTSGTTSTTTFTWDNTVPTFGLQEYELVVVLPSGGGTITKTTVTNSLTIDTRWTGTATAKIRVKDLLGNYSDYSATIDVTKAVPGNITSTTVTTIGSKILLDWDPVAKGTLPVLGYEIRSDNSGWGTDTSYLWRGSVSDAQVVPPSNGSSTTYYIKAYDSENNYSATAYSYTYTKTATSDVLANTITYSYSSDGTGTCTIKWSSPTIAADKFAIKAYKVSKTGGTTSRSIVTLSDSWTIPVDWTTSATITISTVDVLDQESTGVTSTLYYVPINVSTSTFTSTVKGDTLEVSWTTPTATRNLLAWTRTGTTAVITDTAHGYTSGTIITLANTTSAAAIPNGNYTITAVTTDTYTITCLNGGTASGTVSNTTNFSLGISEYEIRGSDNTTILYTGTNNLFVIPKSVLTQSVNVSWYLRAKDSVGNYSTNSKNGTATIAKPSVASNGSTSAISTSTTVVYNWTEPTVVAANYQFPISYYRIVLSRQGSTDFTAELADPRLSYKIDWLNKTASLKIYSVDVLGYESDSPLTIDLTVNGPDQVGELTTPFTFASDTIKFSWPQNSKSTSQFVVSGYEVRDTDTSWGSTGAGLIWKGDATELLLEGKLYIPSASVYDFYIKAFDAQGNYSTTVRRSDLTVTAPGQPSVVTPTYSDTETTSAQVTLSWTCTKGSYDIGSYVVKITKPGPIVLTRTVTTNYITTDADWLGDATVEVTPYDVLNNAGTVRSTIITKTRPSAPTTTSLTQTTSIDGITFKWNPAVAGSLGVAGYAVFSTTPSNPKTDQALYRGPSTSYLKSSGITASTNSIVVYSYDTDGEYSLTGTTVSISIAVPSAVSLPNEASVVTYNSSLTNATAQFKWSTPSSTFPISYYTVSFATTSPSTRTLISTRSTTDWEVPADWTAGTTGTLSITATDVMGLTSTASTLVVNKQAPSQPGVVTVTSQTGTSISLDWPDLARTSLPVIGYILRTDIQADPSTQAGLIFRGSVSGAIVDLKDYGLLEGGSKTFYLYAYDSSGTYGTYRSYTYSVPTIANTASVTAKFITTDLTSASAEITWLDVAPTFGLKYYEVSEELTLASCVTTGSNTITVSSNKGLHIGDIVTGTYVTTARTITNIVGTTVTLSGTTSAGTGSCTFSTVKYINSTSTTVSADWLGSKTFRVKTVNNLGWKSSGATTTLTKAVPGSPSNLYAQVIDNTVLLYWSLPTITSLPISLVRVKRGSTGSTWSTATLVGDKSGTFTTLTELQAGNFVYHIAAVDTDNNESTSVSIQTKVAAPPDYIFNGDWDSALNGTLSNGVLDTVTSKLVFPVNTTETWTQHFSVNNSFATPQAQIDAGYPIYVQPGLSTGYYEETFDYQTIVPANPTLGASQVSVTVTDSTVTGTISRVITIWTSPDNSTWTVFNNTTTAFASNFRYVKVRITYTQSTTGALAALSALNVRLDAKQRTDSGSVALSLGGAHPQYNLAPDYYSLWTPGSLPSTGFPRIGGDAANTIISSTGPSGNTETIWACIDNDVGNDADGGWDGSAFTISPSNSYLFVVFIKTTTNNGDSYWGTHSNGTGDILTLAGVSNTNPYFWSGDLPALNTWYMVSGYIHESTYGTTDTSLSGIWPLTGGSGSGGSLVVGDRLVAGTEFKLPSNATTLMHRSYHYYNITNSGLQVQFMARPVVLSCTSSTDALAKLNYLRDCATKMGASVVPNVNPTYTDITSINVTPQVTPGATVTTTVVDFYDKPNPYHFNILNYTSAGVLTGGTIGWTVRGY